MKHFGGDEEEKEGKKGAVESEKGDERCSQMQTAVGGAAEAEVDMATTSRNSGSHHIARKVHRHGSQWYG